MTAALLVHLVEVFHAELEAACQILVEDYGVYGEFLGRAMEEDLAFEKQVCAVGDAESLFDIMVGDEHTDVFLFQLPDYVLNVFDGNWVYSGKGLVKHDELGVDGKTACYLGASSFSSRELVSEVLAYFLQAELCDEAFELLALIFAALVCHLKYGCDVVFDGHLPEYACFLGEVTYAFAGSHVYWVFGDFLASEVYVSGIGDHEPCGHIETCGLACSVGTEQSYYLSLVYVERDVVDHGAFAVDFDEPFAAQLHTTLIFVRGFVGVCSIHRGKVTNKRAEVNWSEAQSYE